MDDTQLKANADDQDYAQDMKSFVDSSMENLESEARELSDKIQKDVVCKKEEVMHWGVDVGGMGLPSTPPPPMH